MLAVIEDEWSVSSSGRFTSGTYWIGTWVDPRIGLDGVEKRKILTYQPLCCRNEKVVKS
jgi:hypothetical protein